MSDVCYNGRWMSRDEYDRLSNEGPEKSDLYKLVILKMQNDRMRPVYDAAMAVGPERMLQAADAMTHLGEPGVGSALIVLADACRRAKEGTSGDH